MNPIEIIPTTSFAEVMRVERRALATNKNDEEPIVANAISFTVSLFNKGAQIGWLGENSLGWAILVTDPTKALVLEQYPDNGVTYYRIKGTARYMSVSTGAYVGFYNWLGATGFKMQGTNMVSDYNGQKLSFYSTANQYLYAWDAYTVLDVKLESTHKSVIPNQPLTDLIEHVVVVMLENRSFDNMLGGLYPKKTMAGLYRGLKGNETNPLDPNNPGKGSVQVFQGEIDQATWIMPYPDPGELFTDMNEQIFGTANPGKSATSMMTGFAWNYGKQPGAPLTKGGPDVMPDPKNIMQYYHQDAVPMTTFLAKQFAVCDWWFASGPVQMPIAFSRIAGRQDLSPEQIMLGLTTPTLRLDGRIRRLLNRLFKRKPSLNFWTIPIRESLIGKFTITMRLLRRCAGMSTIIGRGIRWTEEMCLTFRSISAAKPT